MVQRYEWKSSNESANSEALFITENARISRLLLATNLGRMTDSAILKRSLSLNSVISTASSFASVFQTARSRPDLQQLNQIGAGLQGAVFEQVGKPLALKKENPGNERLPSNLRHEYTIHCNIWTAFKHYQSISSEVHIPKPFKFISRKDNTAFWDELLPKTPHAYRALISQFCAPEQHIDTTDIEAILNHPQNKHCLARVYLGMANGTIDHKTPLRNFPLYLDSMEQIGIETLPLANAMGKAYAILHWGAAINGDDVEFVLGTSATEALAADHELEFQHRAVQLYLLDFGQCEAVDLTQDPDVVYQAFKGAMGYIEAGNIILSDKKLNTKFNMDDFMQEYEEYAEDFL
ncbi:hypothetical protein N7453_003530 [Penicillium expansum]|nr:hypothetical protein N7453_003530 [Penicillium expansum]